MYLNLHLAVTRFALIPTRLILKQAIKQAQNTNNIAYLVCYANIVEYSLRYF